MFLKFYCMKKIIIFVSFFLITLPLWSQTTVSGLITDENGVPLPGASVIEEGTQNGVSADFDGIYSIEISEG